MRLLLGLTRLHDLPLALDVFLVAFGCRQRELARQQVVARIAVRDLHDLATPPQFLHVVSENDFHDVSLAGPKGPPSIVHWQRPQRYATLQSQITNHKSQIPSGFTPPCMESARAGGHA